jgi:exonuclease 3'-5' domain-containing protein 1
VGLCRYSTLSILTILIYTGIPTRHAYLIDVHTLGAQAFETIGSKYKSLKDVLQDEKIVKVFFDVRNGSDTLFAHFCVALKGGRRCSARGECDEEDYSINEILERPG